MHRRTLVAAALLGGAATASAALLICVATVSAQAKPSPAVSLVRQLYTDFACEAVVDEPECDAQHQLVGQPRAVLAKYFDDHLVNLWVADRRCVERTREECNLDFSPIWASQDPAGTIVHIKASDDPATINVEVIHLPAGGERSNLRYSLVRTTAGWRIHDIAKGKEWSLVALLSQKQ